MYDESLDSTTDDTKQCGNCSQCQPSYFSLAQLPEEQIEQNKLPDVIEFVRTKLKTLTIDLGSNITSALELECVENLPVAEHILTDKYRKRFLELYYQVTKRRDLMEWIWITKFGWEIVNCKSTELTD